MLGLHLFNFSSFFKLNADVKSYCFVILALFLFLVAGPQAFHVPFLLKDKAPTYLLFHFRSQVSDCIFLNTTAKGD